jgi:hypothetical protein
LGIAGFDVPVGLAGRVGSVGIRELLGFIGFVWVVGFAWVVVEEGAEETGLTIALGLRPVVRAASRHEVVVAGGTAVGDGVDVVPLQVVAAVAAIVDANHPLEQWRVAQAQRRAYLGFDMAPVVHNGADGHAVV